MSPRAAWRLERLGFEKVFDYAPGKDDWTAAALPTEGESRPPRAGDAATDVPTCAPEETVGALRDRLEAQGEQTCVVVTEGGVVLGRMGADDLSQDQRARVEDVMEIGPTTVRWNEGLIDLLGRMQRAEVEEILLSDGEGRLLGTMHRAHGESFVERLQAAHEHHHHAHR